ncbi:hypothetical protein CRYUN_Cryun18bG0041400 [Craigia yunnanensis]
MVASPQVLFDCSIITKFDPINDVPFDYYRCRGGQPKISITFDPINDVPFDYYCCRGGQPKISITVPLNSGQKISLLKSIITLHAKNDKAFEFLPRIEIVNETKNTKWTYSKHFIGIPESKNTLC